MTAKLLPNAPRVEEGQHGAGIRQGRGSGVRVGVRGVVVAAQAEVAGRQRRLGSVVTSQDGGFEIDYTAPEGVRDEWLLIVTVSAPDDCGTAPEETTSPLASCRRDNPAARETFHVRIAEAKLVEAGVPVRPEERDPDEVIAGDRAKRDFQSTLDTEARRVLAGRFAERKQVRAQAEAHLARFLQALSDADGDRPGSRYVPPGGSIREAELSALRDGVTGTLNNMAVTTVGVFTEEQLVALRQEYGDDLSRVPARVVEDIVWPKRPERASTLVSRGVTWWCHRQVPINDCVKILDPGSGEPPAEPEPEDPEEPPAEDPPAATVPELIDRLTRTMTSPEEKVLFGVRPSIGDVQGNVDGFALRSGPADVPATYDFHRMEIAFDSVWQELFDKGTVEVGRELYEKFVELGEDPNEYLLDSGGKPKPNIKLAEPRLEDPPFAVAEAFEITQREWNALNGLLQDQLITIAGELTTAWTNAKKFDAFLSSVKLVLPSVDIDGIRRAYLESVDREARVIQTRGTRIISYAKEKLQAPRDFDQMHELLDQLGQALKEPYRFNIYAAGSGGRSVNFGVLATYRQKWTPVTYQVGELVKTVPLAPKEVRKYSRKLARKLTRAEKESSSTLQSLRTESSETVRAEAEIISKARTKTNYDVEAKAGVDIEFVKIEGSTKMSQETEQQSQETKKEFREAVFKAATEYKAEHKLEVEVTDTSEFSEEESGEISNPNDELPVTYLFYELQRRYRIEEKLHKVTPVILVAQEFPDQIDEDWIVAHDWILRQHILHPSMIPAMDYLSSKVVGDEHALQELYDNLQQQRGILDRLTDELVVLRSQVSSRYDALQRSMRGRADAIEADNNEGFLEGGVEGLFGGADADPEAMKAREEAARDAYERLARQERDLTGRLARETTAVAEITDKYTKELADHLNRKTQISRLRVHLKANIFHYMQAIWAHEPTDQRYFRLRDVQVPRLTGTKTYKITPDPDAIPQPPTWTKPHKLTAHVEIDPNNLTYDSLGDIADLDNMLGFKGNYMIFPLKQGNALTDFRMTAFYDPFTGLRDPDTLANWTLHEFAEYVCCLRKHLTEEQFNNRLPGLIETYRRLKERDNDDNELVVPTGSLYIEALPGAHPILEDFKLAHRAIDVKKVQGEVRGVELENIRMAARLLEGEREDPTIEKKIVIEGSPAIAVNPDDA